MREGGGWWRAGTGDEPVDGCHPEERSDEGSCPLLPDTRSGVSIRLRRSLAPLGMTVLSAGTVCGVALALLACEGTLPPLRGQMEVGRDAYAVVVAGKGIAGGDLYAVRTEGGVAVPITFTNVGEMRPALSPDG